MRLHDSVLHRIVQIVQEGIIMGVDVADLMRQIRLVPHTTEEDTLALDPQYLTEVERSHKVALEEAEVKKGSAKQGDLVFS